MDNEDADSFVNDKMHDWRKAVQLPTPYRIGNTTLRVQTSFVWLVLCGGLILLLLAYSLYPRRGPSSNIGVIWNEDAGGFYSGLRKPYNSTYPLTKPEKIGGLIRYRIAIVADLDTNSKSAVSGNTWFSYLKKGYLTVDSRKMSVSVMWDNGDMTALKSTLSQGGRGMELSELIVFDGRLLSVDDRTGVIYEVQESGVVPWVLLTDGGGNLNKGFKAEWCTVRDETLYVGGLGKEWTSTTGELINLNPQWVKAISSEGVVKHIDWHEKYNVVRSAVGINYPGYMIHEAVVWSEVKRRWFFLPRRASRERYDERKDERRGTNFIITADEYFKNIKIARVGEVIATHGFSSFKFIPDTNDNLIVALRTEEDGDTIASYIMAFDVDGHIVLPESKIDNIKFEGIEFI